MPLTKALLFRLAAITLPLLFVFLVLEIGSRITHYLGYSRDASLTEIRRSLHTLQPQDQKLVAPRRRYQPWIGAHILHPYLGYVRNPENHQQVLNERLITEPVNEHGFFGPSPLEPASSDQLVIAITGGSAACELYLDAGDALSAALKTEPAFSKKRLKLVCLALGGMKQPQQLLAVQYFLALGGHFDAVVNFDGFNDVVLPLAENEPLGVAGHYPRYWPVYATMGLNVAQATLMSEAGRLEQRRQRWARRVAGTPLRHSVVALSLWYRCDRSWKVSIQDRQNRMRETLQRRPDKLSPQESGPPDQYVSLSELRNQVVQLWVNGSTQMARICTANKIRYFHFLQPNQYFKGSKVFTDEEKRKAFGGPNYYYRRDATAGYPLLVAQAEILRQRGVRFYDLTMLFKDQADTLYRDECCHYNQDGYNLVAEQIAATMAHQWNGPNR
ncbi:MAG: hypothetical protein CMJ81_03570 [Planctomycetaceae bacterium]|nr:hypothetical protein [Planctomycetaceae bacterium]MBP63000.1 hypothetical protein [Planctomycetaceae bacterium]